MPTGLEIRARMDAETAKALLLLNGGGAIALLAFLPSILDIVNYEPLVRAVLWGVLVFMSGLVAAVIHNNLRRRCSLHYEQHQMRPPGGKLLGIPLWAPTVCCVSQAFMALSLLAFMAAGAYVAYTGLAVLDDSGGVRGLFWGP